MRAILMVGDSGSLAMMATMVPTLKAMVDDNDGDDVHEVKSILKAKILRPRTQSFKTSHPKKLVSEALVPEGIRQGQGLAPWAQEHGLPFCELWLADTDWGFVDKDRTGVSSSDFARWH